jgi:hypothetical protein
MSTARSSSVSRRDPSSRLLADCCALGRLAGDARTSAATRLEDELGSELASRLVAALRSRHRRSSR